MADQVGERLLDRDHDPGHLRQFLAEFLDHLLAAAAGRRVEADDDLRGVDSLGVFVEFGPPRSPAEVGDAPYPADPLVDHGGDRVRCLERGSRGQEHVDLHTALVEGRQEVASEPHQHGDARPHRDCHRPQDRQRVAYRKPDRTAREQLEPSKHEAVLFPLHQSGGRQKPVGEHRRHGQRDDE